MSRPGKNIRVWDKSTNPGFVEGKEFSVMTGVHGSEDPARVTAG